MMRRMYVERDVSSRGAVRWEWGRRQRGEKKVGDRGKEGK